MRWQTLARVAIAVFVLVFAGVVYVALRRPPVADGRSETPRVDQKTVVELGPGTHRRTNSDGKLTFELNFKSQFTYADGRTVLRDAELTLPQADGGTATIFGGEMELIMPASGGPPLQTATITKGAKLRTSDGLEMTSAQAHLRRADGHAERAGRRPVHQGPDDRHRRRRELRPWPQRDLAARPRRTSRSRRTRKDRARSRRPPRPLGWRATSTTSSSPAMRTWSARGARSTRPS